MALGLYLHIPFCAAICNYCNFNRSLLDPALKTRYVDALVVEIARAGDGSAVDSIFFGGGTPSLLEPAEVSRLLRTCRESFTVADSPEVTLEANPETVDVARLEGFRAAGINRLSLGVQSFRDDELSRLSRLHSASRAGTAFMDARQAGFSNVSLDLMMWLPGQSVEQWEESVRALAALGPDHASMYLLELYPNAPLREEMARGAWSLAPDDDAAEMYLRGMATLEGAGYEQYEISNVARDGKVARHNLKYWSDGEWLGFGCGAHSTRGGVRWKNISSTTEYIAAVLADAPLAAERRSLTSREQWEEAVITGLRLVSGIDVAQFQARYGVDVLEACGSDLDGFRESGLLIYDGGRLRLTRQGMLLAHEVMAVFID